MSWLQLAPSDRDRWGITEERIEFNLSTIGIRSIAAMRKQTGFSLEEAASLAFDGKIRQLPDGSETVEYDDDAFAAIVWLICYATGHRDIPWAEWDPSRIGLQIEWDVPDAGDDEGKAPAETDGSSTTTTS